MRKKILASMAFLLTLFSIFSGVLAQPYAIDVRFWNDENMNSAYKNEMMKVYFQNKTYTGGYDYTYKCYHANYTNGSAIILVNETNIFDLLITDGNLQWGNTTGCPTRVENYAFWATVQSYMLIDHNETYDYSINVTYHGQPRSYFWGTQSVRQILSALYWLAVLAIIIILEWYLTKGGGQPSWLLPLIIFVIAIIVKLAFGF
jgi:hypothetical protein